MRLRDSVGFSADQRNRVLNNKQLFLGPASALLHTWADIPPAIARLQAAGADRRVPLLRALYYGRITHMELHWGGSAKQFKTWAAAVRVPALTLLGDDDHATLDGSDT